MRRIPRAVAVTLVAATILAGCQQLFTTSLGKTLARKDLPIPATLSASQAADLAAQAKVNEDSKLAGALVSSLVDQIAATTDTAVRAELQASAVSAAVVASGTSAALTGLITDYAAGVTPTAETLQDIVATITAGATADVVAALTYLDSSSTGGLSAADAEAAGIEATDMAIAAVVIASTVIPAGSDPTQLDIASLSVEDKATIETAKNIMLEAAGMVEAGSASESLLNDIIGKFSLTTTP